MIRQYTTYSPEESKQLAYLIGQEVKSGSIICFKGDLAAGKTTFIKGLAAGAANIPEEQVNSPTFNYLNIYQGTKTLYHFDLYRLGEVDEFLAMGFEEYLFSNGICCIEWSERIEAIIPTPHYEISISHCGEDSRLIRVEFKT